MDKYEKMNYFFNRLFVNNNNNYIFEDNIHSLLFLADVYLDSFDENEYVEECAQQNLTYEDVMNLSREIINSLDIDDKIKQKYLNYFDELLDKGLIDFVYEEKDFYNDSQSVHEYNRDTGETNDYININRYFSFEDVRVLIHEFFHYLNVKESLMPTNDRMMLTEFISIYFEKYAVDYLRNKYNLTNKDLHLNTRLLSSRSRAKVISNYGFSLLTFQGNGKIDENSIDFVTNYLAPLKKEIFDSEIDSIYKNIKNFKDDEIDNKINLFISDIEYFMGTIFTIFLNKKDSVRKMIYLNEHINDETDIYDLLEYVGVDLRKLKEFVEGHHITKESYNYFKNTIKDYISEYSYIKEKENTL